MTSEHDTNNAGSAGYSEHERRQSKGGLHWDPTINAGHLLTFASMAIALVVAWNSIDKRVVVLEEARAYQKLRDDVQDQAVTQQLVAIKEGVSDLKALANEIRREQAQRRAAVDGKP